MAQNSVIRYQLAISLDALRLIINRRQRLLKAQIVAASSQNDGLNKNVHLYFQFSVDTCPSVLSKAD